MTTTHADPLPNVDDGELTDLCCDGSAIFSELYQLVLQRRGLNTSLMPQTRASIAGRLRELHARIGDALGRTLPLINPHQLEGRWWTNLDTRKSGA